MAPHPASPERTPGGQPFEATQLPPVALAAGPPCKGGRQSKQGGRGSHWVSQMLPCRGLGESETSRCKFLK